MITNLGIGYNGRIGNQLFQYAVCYAQSKRLGVEFVIPQENVENTKNDGCYDFTTNDWIPYRFLLYDCFEITAKTKKNIITKNIFQEPHFHYTPSIDYIQDDTSLQGYYQSEKYFLDYKQSILSEFTFKPKIINNCNNIISNFKNNEIVAIHIRRGDYLINSNVSLLEIDYFQKAINYFCDKEYNFLIISDDINWCKIIFPENYNIRFVEKTTDFEDLCLMSLANHNIISNSTFSWWGAYLNKNKDKKIIAPNDWFKDKINKNTKDLIPKNWIII